MKRTTYQIMLLLSASVFFAGCETVQQALEISKPSASLKGLKFQDITLQSATLLFDIEVENPYPVGLPLLNMDYTVASGSNTLFSGKTHLQTTIPAKDKKTVSLPAKVNYLDLVRAFKGIRPGSKIPYKADAGLSVDTQALGQIRLPLSKTGEFSVPAMEGFKLINGNS